jgi:hypothetical protein
MPYGIRASAVRRFEPNSLESDGLLPCRRQASDRPKHAHQRPAGSGFGHADGLRTNLPPPLEPAEQGEPVTLTKASACRCRSAHCLRRRGRCRHARTRSMQSGSCADDSLRARSRRSARNQRIVTSRDARHHHDDASVGPAGLAPGSAIVTTALDSGRLLTQREGAVQKERRHTRPREGLARPGAYAPRHV